VGEHPAQGSCKLAKQVVSTKNEVEVVHPGLECRKFKANSVEMGEIIRFYHSVCVESTMGNVIQHFTGGLKMEK